MRALLLFLVFLLACPNGAQEEPDAAPRDATVRQDASGRDAEPSDAPLDTGTADATVEDAAPEDASPDDAADMDAGEGDAGEGDAGEEEDGGELDAGSFFRLSVGTSTGGIVRSSPGAIACTETSGPCEELFPEGTQVTLTASASIDFAFDRWAGDCSGGPIATVTMDADRSCTASFIGTAGQVALVPPPLTVVPNQTEDPANIVIFRERSSFTLPAGLPLDLHVPDLYGAFPGSGQLPAGLSVDVYFVHFDPVGTPGTPVRRTARLFFPQRIVGIIAAGASLDQSDGTVGLTSTVTYPAPGTHPDRGLELGLPTFPDTFRLEGDRRHVVLDFQTTTSSDQFRIVTLAAPGAEVPFLHNAAVLPVPAPASVLAGGQQSNTAAFAFLESSGTLSTALDVDVVSPGDYLTPAALTPGSIPAGTGVESWMLHFNPLSGTRIIEGTVTFERDVLGLILISSALNAADATVGSSSTAYPATDTLRGVELGSGERVRLADDGRSVRFRFSASAIDQMRVILFR